jgi:HSP20 family molecular chaperone IbpA
MSDIDLDVTKNMLKAESNEYKLRLYLPQRVDPDKGDAKFDSATFILTVTLPIDEQEW